MEIFDDELDRWVHLDSCENVIDTPLMYDKVIRFLCLTGYNYITIAL